MRRHLYLLSPSLILLEISVVRAQVAAVLDTTPSQSMGQYIWKMFLTALTLGGSAATPYLTKYATMGVLLLIGKAKVNVPAPVLNILSTVIAGVYAGVMGSQTDMPLHGDTGVVAGGSIGGLAQHFANNQPVKPTPEAMAKVVEKKPEATSNV